MAISNVDKNSGREATLQEVVAAAQQTVADGAVAHTDAQAVIAALAEIEANTSGSTTVAGTVTVSNFPTTQTVAGSVTVNNPQTSVSISNGAALAAITQLVSGSVTISNPQTSVTISSLPAIAGSVTVNNPVSSVTVSSLPAIAGSVTINNPQSSVTVSNTVTVTGAVTVMNAATQTHVVIDIAPTLSVTVSNFPATQVVAGSVTVANSVTLNTLPAGTNTVGAVLGAFLGAAFTTSTVQAVASTDVGAYRSVSVQITTQGTNSTITFQSSNDNTNWSSCALQATTASDAQGSTSTTSTGTYSGSLPGRYFRLNVTGISAGTTAGTVEFFTEGTANQPARQPPVVSIGDALANFSSASTVINEPLGYNGATWDRRRTATIFKTTTATASGDTALWTPTSGKKFRVLRYMVQITADASITAGAELDVVLRDATTPIGVGFSVYVPAAAVTTTVGQTGSGWITIDNGYLSVAANNVLNLNLSAALVTGKIRCVVIGTEE